MSPPVPQTSRKGGNGFLFFFSIPAALIGLAFCYLVISTLFEAHQISSWPMVDGMVTETTLQKSSGKSSTERVTATYTYTYNGTTYIGDRVSLHTGSDNIGTFHGDTYAQLKLSKERGAPIQVYVNPEHPEQSILFPTIRWGVVGLYSLMGTLFGLVGFGMLYAVWYSKKSTGSTTQLASQYPSHPWMHKQEWRENKILSLSSTNALVIIGLALFWNLISLPILFIAPEELAKGNYWILIALLFPCIGVILIYVAVVAYIRAARFRDTYLTLDTIPVVPGKTIKGRIITSSELLAAQEATIKITCQCKRRERRGSKVETVISTHYSAESTVIPTRATTAHNQGMLVFQLQIPEDQPATDTGPLEVRYNWYVYAAAKLPGADFSAQFEIPVFISKQLQ